GRRRLFDVDDVEGLARRSRQSRSVETRVATITTSVTQLTDRGPVYRGRLAVGLAEEASFEDAAEVVWDTATPSDLDAWCPLSIGRPPATFSALDRIRWAVLVAGAGDPLRSDARAEKVVRSARRLVATAVDVLDPVSTSARATDRSEGRALASTLTTRLTSMVTPAAVRAVDAALVVLADHELATSTMAVRMAASTRADVYDALLAGLSTVAGPLHGGASPNAYALLEAARRHGARRGLDDTLRWQGRLHGFGHSVYREGDPRFAVLWERFCELATPADRRLAEEVVDLAAREDVPFPNVDLALAALAWTSGMAPDAGQTMFMVARIVGWVAHYLEELDERPLRYRARGVYATPRR
ncbi:MAG TPA: citrate/2-methylcitrate synthase, partial [Acidimicrobiales bacterium]|nr:citrate/2-methylcitrate synthase [Acidimicrobiales bacterium]